MGLDIAGLGSIADFAKGVVDRIWPDPATKAKALQDLEELKQKGELAQLAADTGLMQAQIEVNKVEAASTNWFVAGWRPAVGWCCALGLLYETIIEPIARFTAVTMFHYAGAFPDIGTGLLTTTLTGMLGIGAMRTWEKVTKSEGNR